MMRKILKWIGIVLGSLVGLLVLAGIVLYILGNAKVKQTYTIPVKTVPIPVDAESIQRGEHITAVFLCQYCHADTLGGKLYFDEPGLLSVPSPNLTSGVGGIGGSYTDEDWVRAIQHGVGKDGRPLFFMMSQNYQFFSAEDMGALIAYLKSLPPVDNEPAQRHIEPMAKIMAGAGVIPPFAADLIDHAAPAPAAPEPGVTAAYGEYLARTCTECHGPNLNGMPFGPPGQEVLTPNLTRGGMWASWTEQDFTTTLRSGVTPDRRYLNDEMPWKYIGQMNDEELGAVWTYLQSLPALEQGK